MMIPIVGCFSLYVGTGGELKGLPIGIVNNEVTTIDECFSGSLVTTQIQGDHCRLNKISCRLIDELQGEFISKVEWNILFVTNVNVTKFLCSRKKNSSF